MSVAASKASAYWRTASMLTVALRCCGGSGLRAASCPSEISFQTVRVDTPSRKAASLTGNHSSILPLSPLYPPGLHTVKFGGGLRGVKSV